MSTVASAGDCAELPDGVGGSAGTEFAPLIRTFARVFGHRRDAGAALAVYRHGQPLAHIWTGYGGDRPWTADTGTVVFSATKGITATVIHRLADRGLIDYYAPMAEYWPEFGANGKAGITVEQVMTHRAGLSALRQVAQNTSEVLDHELMEQRLAAAAPDHLLGTPTYHALTYGWLMSGLARAVTGKSMGQLFREEVTEPLGIRDGLHLGYPGPGSATRYAPMAGTQLSAARNPIASLVLGRGHGLPGVVGAAVRCLFVPGLEAILEGAQPSLLQTEQGAANGVCTASALATVYGALAGDGVVNGARYLSGHTLHEMRKVRSYQLDHALFYLPMMWHLGYHSIPVPGGHTGFGHIGLNGSFGWVDPRSGISVGFVHNRFTLPLFGLDISTVAWLLPLIVGCLRGNQAELTPAARSAA
ncbi:serine hydrolase domain-containing protein [Nocardia asteroides]|uniref:serine hydrolase domain-containing protein n=1 Tax=Nocardia asteroides TaxID=1824 RepID=UPI001E360272|nr:serine hydrolase domain-containing protein [Nocardia asteroides]UGT60746.1 beta-lactamase family protein [Nocardia asteroides]